VVSEVTDMLIRGSLLEDIAGLPVVVFPPSSLSGSSLATKYATDFIAALIALIGLVLLAAPVFIWQTASHRNYTAWWRSTRLLVRVISGQNSLVGPLRAVDGERLKPGVTGIWRTATKAPHGAREDRLDMYYLQNWSLTSDIEIMFLTVKQLPRLFRASGADVTSKEGGE
jgi:lipopolysaccharide/colanic/teichoic acid biosynthesis glycosyltransferase